MIRQQPEFRLACVVADYLRTCVPDLLWTHFPAGEYRTEATGGRLQRMGLAKGWPDYLFVLRDGSVCGVELKSEGGRQNPEQHAIQAAFEARGALYFVVRSLEDLKQTLAELGVQTREHAA